MVELLILWDNLSWQNQHYWCLAFLTWKRMTPTTQNQDQEVSRPWFNPDQIVQVHALPSTKNPDLLVQMCSFQAETYCFLKKILHGPCIDKLEPSVWCSSINKQSAILSEQNYLILLLYCYIFHHLLLRGCSKTLVWSNKTMLQTRYTESSNWYHPTGSFKVQQTGSWCDIEYFRQWIYNIIIQ